MKNILKFNIMSILFSILFFLMIILEMINYQSYLDELIGVVSGVYIIFLFITNKLQKKDIYTLFILFLFVLIGFVSSFYYRIQTSKVAIIVDLLANIKVFLAFFAALYIFRRNNISNEISLCFSFLSKIFIIIAFSFCCINMFFDVGMSVSERFGIRAFNFIFEHAHQFTVISFFMYSMLVIKKEKYLKIYTILFLFSIFFNLKGPSIIFVIIFIFLNYYYRKHNKITISALVPLVIIILIFGVYQINNYLLNENSPRSLFYRYGFVTASSYFPLGSGFATFGSDMASRYYSPLYILYGFHNLWGLNPKDGWFLSDSGYSTYIAQCGYIGFLLFGYFLYRLFKMFNKNKVDTLLQSLIMTIFVQYLVHAVGSSILKSSQGMLGFIILAMLLAVKQNCGRIEYEKN